MKKRLLSLFLALVMTCSLLPAEILAAETELSWSGGTITLASGTKIGNATLTTLSIYKRNVISTYPTITSVTQDGNTINITLAEGTDPSYPLQMDFSAGSAYVEHSGNTCTLNKGKGTATVAVQAKPAPVPNAAPLGTGTFTVNFTVEKGEVYAVKAPSGEGFTFTGDAEAAKGKDYSFGIEIKEGYDGTNMVVKVNGAEISSIDGKYTVPAVNENLVITVDGVEKKEIFSITKPVGEGFTFTGADTVYEGDDYSFTIAVDSAYKNNMVVKVNGAEISGNDGKYTVPAASENLVITVDGIEKKTVYTVTLTEGEGYTLAGQATSYADEPYTFTVSVDDAIYWADKIEVFVDGEKVTLTNGKYTFVALDCNKTVSVQNVIEREVLTITKPEVEGVTVSGDDTVREGKPYTFTVSVDEKYDGTNMVVKVNGAEVTYSDNRYTVNNTTEDMTIDISGIVKKDICEIIKPADGKFTFTGEDFAYKGNDYVFTVTPNLGYIANVTVNGVTVEGSGNTYTVNAEDDEMVIAVTTQRVSLPEKELNITTENNTYTVDVTDNRLNPRSSYHATVTDIKITGAKVTGAFESGTTVYFNLHSDTPDNAEISVEFLYTYNSCTLKGNTVSVKLQDGEVGLKHTVTADYSNGWRTKSATYDLIFFRELPAEEPPVCAKDTDTKEAWKDRNLEIDLSEYFTDADAYYLVNGEDKTPIEGKIYTFTSGVAGEHSLVFSAENEAGFSEQLTITVNVKDIESGIYIGNITGNGSLNFVQFMDSEGELIEGIEVAYDMPNRAISVVLPKDYSVSGTVKAKFDLTQNESGYPFVSTSTETTGNRAFNSRFTEKNIALTNGAANFTFYYYNKSTGAVDNGGQTRFVIQLKIDNDLPVLAEGIEAEVSAEITAGENYKLDLSPIFTDANDETLNYYVSINDAAPVAADVNYSYTTNKAGTHKLVFTANDTKDTSTETYTVILTVKNSENMNSMSFVFPEGIEPQFMMATGYDENGVEIATDTLSAEAEDGAYIVLYPENVEIISVRDQNGRGMAVAAVNEGTVTFREVSVGAVDYLNNEIEATVKATYDGHTAAGKDNTFLLAADKEYTYTATPKNTSIYAATSVTEALVNGEVIIKVNYNNPKTITVTTGAKAYLYYYNQYYNFTEYTAAAEVDNGDGTTTFYFTSTADNNLVWRTEMEGYITKAGWCEWNYKNMTVTYSENDATPDTRVDYSVEANRVGDDSVVVNVNGQNHLKLTKVGSSYTLKAYRIWEIIKTQTDNHQITPDFHYNIISGDNVISLTEKKSKSTNDGDWMTVTALKEGTAVIEVTYDAMQVSGGHYPGIYGASDPARTGLIVVTVGGETPDVDFGIKGKSSQGNLTYEKSTPKAWDAEFDTLYFTGEYGEIKLAPTVTVTDDTITEVAVSNDKGESWTVLTSNEGEYTAKITSGNNIIRVTTEKDAAYQAAYQIVRGDKVEVRLVNVTHPDQPFAKGDKVRVYIDGLHQPIPKMAGNYNPGYKANTDGDSSTHMSFMWNGERVNGAGAQYTFSVDANYVEVTIPENTDQTSFTLSEGCIATGVIGLKNFVNGENENSHRNIPDGGCTTRGSDTTFHTRSVLPEITIELGGAAAENTEPYVKAGAQTEATITLGKTFAINLETVFEDAEGNELTYKLGEETLENAYFTFTPNATGEYQLIFTASDGELEVSHRIVLTVEQASTPSIPPAGDDFGLPADEIEGYVYVSFEDNGKRVEGEKGVSCPNPLGTIIARTKVPYVAEDTIADVTLRLLEAKNMKAFYSGSTKGNFYLSSIGNFTVGGIDYDSFGEFDAGVGSGWMITHNDTFIEYGASEFEVADGDIVRWQYTCQYGADIGDPYFDSMGGASALPGTGSGTTEIVPEVKVESDGSAKAEVSDKELKDAIAQSKSEEAPVITIAPEGGENAESLTVSIPTDTLAKVYDQTNASVNIETAQASVVIPNEVIKNITENAAGSTVSIIIEQKKPEDTKADVLTDKQAENAVIVEVKIVSRDENISEFAEDIHIEIPVKSDKHDKNKDYRVYIIHDDGSKEWTRGTSVSDGDKHHVRIRTRKLSTFILTDIVMEKLADIENHWGIDAINFVYDKNIMTGTSGTTFEPDTVLSRGMLATVLYRLAGSPEVTAENPFPDVKAGEWYTDAVIWAYENGIVSGYDNGGFGPTDIITREQFALMLMNYAKFKGIDTSAKNDLSQFADADDTSLWAQSAMQWASEMSYITGRDTGLAPKMSANRAETATILMRFIENK